MLLTFAIAAFLCVSLVSYAALDYTFSDQRRVRASLKQLSAYEAGELSDAQPLLQPLYLRLLKPNVTRLAAIARRVTPVDYASRVKRRLLLAGLQSRWNLDRFLAVKLVGGVMAAAIAAALWLTGALTGIWLLTAMVLTVTVCFFGVDLYVSEKIGRRRDQIRKDLPEMLDMLTISVEAGLGFDQALTKLVRNRRGALSEEFGRMLQETQAGVSRRDALHHVSERTDVPELDSFVMALVQADAFGVSVSSVLRTQAAELRLRRRQLAEEKAQKAPVKQVFPLILCILPATIVVVSGPAVIGIIHAFSFINR